MRLKKITLLAVTVVFALGCVIWLPQVSLAAPKMDRHGFGHGHGGGGGEEQQSVVESTYKEKGVPAWAREDHPSLKGLRNALENATRNNASPVAIKVLQGLIKARSVKDEVYELDNVIEDDSALEAVCRYEEMKGAVAGEVRRIREEARQQIKNRLEMAWAFKKLGMALCRLGDRAAAEETLTEAAGAAPGDRTVYESLNSLYAQAGVSEMPVFIKGNKIRFDVPPQIINNRTMVPVRKFAESLGSTVQWDPEARQVVFARGAKTIVLVIDNDTARVNGQEIKLDSPAAIVGDRTLVPLRFVAESLDIKVDYFNESKLIAVTE